MTISLAERKRRDIERRLSALDAELEEWCALSRTGQPFATNNSQIRRIKGQLDGMKNVIAAKLKRVDPLEAGANIQNQSLQVHRIWEFFRSKLAQRNIDWYRDFLLAADELAWACYEPIRDLVVENCPNTININDVREPPLVFLNGASTPLALKRSRPVDVEPSLFSEPITSEFKAAVSTMPVPVIGLPWFDTEHLPDALLIGHEVGHIIQDYLRLAKPIDESLKEAVTQIPAVRRPAYVAWREESFSDLYGTLATGPAFVDAMLHYLAPAKGDVEREVQKDGAWGVYPTRTLRVYLCLTLLERMDFKDEARDLRAIWDGYYFDGGKAQPMKDFEADLPCVVAALVEKPLPELGGSTLKSKFAFSKDQQTNAVDEAQRVLDGQMLEESDVRTLFAAAGIAYAIDPVKYDERDGDSIVRRRILKSRSNQVRGGMKRGGGSRNAELEAYDHQRGADLLSALFEENGT